MNEQANPSTTRRLAIGMALATFLIAVYFVTYNGHAISRDEWFLFDATESLARRGSLAQNYQYDAYPPTSLATVEPPSVDAEPLQPVLAAPLFLIAEALPGLGLAHTVWLFNVLVTSFTAGTLYFYGLALNYRARIAAMTALAFGLGTIAWPYSRTFFREPLFTWLALLAAYLTLRLRRQLAAERHSFITLALLGLAFAGALLSKEAALLFVPVIVIEALPARLNRMRLTPRILVALVMLSLVVALLGVVVLNLDTWFSVPRTRYAIIDRLASARTNLSALSAGVTGYLFSPSRSIWLYSPVLLAGLAGLPSLIRQNRWRQIAVPIAMLVMFVTGYAAVRGPDQWYGGLGWGARYMVPVTPFLALWLLPVFEALAVRGAVWWQRGTILLIGALSIGVQILSALVPIQHYSDTLNAQQPPVIPWQQGKWSWRWSPWRVYPELVGDVTPDIAWKHALGPTLLLPVLSVLLAMLALAWLAWWVLRAKEHPLKRGMFLLTTGSLTLAAAITLGVGLLAIREDPRYSGNFQPARDLLAQITDHAQADDVILLNDFTYQKFFMNYYKLREPIVYTLPPSPGERSNPADEPEISSPNPDDLILPAHAISLNYFASKHERLWLVINSSPFVPWAVRPIEQYMTRHYFPAGELFADDLARAVLFDTTPAPPAPAPTWAEHSTNAIFEGGIELIGYDLPKGKTYESGDMVPLSLLWRADAVVPKDYTVGLFVMRDSVPVSQRDAQPLNSFERMGSWRPGSLHRDNHGLQLPTDLPPGEYELWLILYYWETPAERLPVRADSGQTWDDHLVLHTITVK